MIDGVPRVIDLYWDDLDAGAEVLGGFHRDVAQWWNDLRRAAEIQSTGTPLFPIPAVALRREPDVVRRPPLEVPSKGGLTVELQRPNRSTLRRGVVEG